MSNVQDTNSKAQAEPGESSKDVAQNTISSTEKDALGDRALDGVSGGTLKVNSGAWLTSKGQASSGPSG